MADIEIIYPDIGIVLGVHEDIMRRTGDLPAALLHENELGSALGRPQWAAKYENADLLTQAVKLMLGISHAHAFGQGNKRTAMHTALIFLDVNGYTFVDDKDLLAVLLMEAEDETMPSDEESTRKIVAWMRPRMEPISPERHFVPMSKLRPPSL